MPKILLNYGQPARIVNMKGIRLSIFILSILLLSVSSCLLLYMNIFMLDTPESSGKIDFEELRTLDLKINNSAFMLRKNLSIDSGDLDAELRQLKELLYIMTDINKDNPVLNNSIKKLQAYFENKNNNLIKFKTAISDLKSSVNSLKSDYNQLNKNNIKFTLYKKDFFQECITDALFYLAISSKENEMKIFEDTNTLLKIINNRSTPSLVLQKFSNTIDMIYHGISDLNTMMDIFNNEIFLNEDLAIITQNYNNIKLSRARREEVIIELLYAAIICYFIALVVVLRERY